MTIEDPAANRGEALDPQPAAPVDEERGNTPTTSDPRTNPGASGDLTESPGTAGNDPTGEQR